MLSDLLFEHKGKTTNSRILDSSVRKQEVTVVGKGKLKGLGVSLLITFGISQHKRFRRIDHHHGITTAKVTE